MRDEGTDAEQVHSPLTSCLATRTQGEHVIAPHYRDGESTDGCESVKRQSHKYGDAESVHGRRPRTPWESS